MRALRLTLPLFILILALHGCRTDNRQKVASAPLVNADGQLLEATPDRLRRSIEAVKHLHKPMGAPQPGDWLETYTEQGQTFDEYLPSNPVRPVGNRRVLYIQPLGEFTPAQHRIVALAADYMSRFFNLPVRLRDDMPMPNIPKSSRRRSPWGDKQIQAGYITMNILRPTLPDDAAALIAFTSSDLYPDELMNFVFGQASLSERVGVWSLYRLGKPDADDASFRLTLLRTLKIATHETGHMFSMPHCTKYECVMAGTNHLGETDRRPIDVCPECMAKICWATNTDPRQRYARLAEFCAANGLETERRFFEDSIRALDKIRAPSES
jgi:archaemetzincin